MDSRVAFGRLVCVFLRAGWRPPPLTDSAAERLLDDITRVNPLAKLGLSPLQGAILQRLANGQTYAEIERALGISHEALRTRQRELFARLGARNGPHAVAEGFRLGLLR